MIEECLVCNEIFVNIFFFKSFEDIMEEERKYMLNDVFWI